MKSLLEDIDKSTAENIRILQRLEDMDRLNDEQKRTLAAAESSIRAWRNFHLAETLIAFGGNEEISEINKKLKGKKK